MTDEREVSDTNLQPDELERDDAVIGRAFRWSAAVIALAAIVGGGTYYWLTRKPAAAVTAQQDVVVAELRKAAEVEIPRVHFTDITRAAGITFVHVNGAYGDKLLPETMGGGCAFFDYDNDGDQDLLFSTRPTGQATSLPAPTRRHPPSTATTATATSRT